jgi:MraZ protein
MEHFYSGNAVSAVTEAGHLCVPQFVRRAVERRSGLNEVILGSHEEEPCIVAYDVPYIRSLHAKLERRRRMEERSGLSAKPHHARMRKIFGTAEQLSYDEEGRLELPLMLRRKAGIGDSVLFIGTGETFEIWGADVAVERGDEDLKGLASEMLRQAGADGSEAGDTHAY